MKRPISSDPVEHELGLTRSRILKNLEEGQNLLNRLRKQPQGTPHELLRMRSYFLRQQATIEKPIEQLRSLLVEDQFVYMWNYSLVLLSNLSPQHSPGHAAMKGTSFESALSASVKSRKLYVQGKLGKAAELVTTIINNLLPRIERNTFETDRKRDERSDAYRRYLDFLRLNHPSWKNAALVAEAARHFGVVPGTIRNHTRLPA